MPLFKHLKALICRISYDPLTLSKVNISKYSSVAPSERHAVNIFKNTKTSAVTIISKCKEINEGKIEIFEDTGSGVVWDIEGHIVTNYHVVAETINDQSSCPQNYEINILTSEGVEEMYNGKIVGANLVNDLAVLKIEAPKNILKPITVGDSTIVEVGHKCFAIGAANSYRHSFTSGIISALNPETTYNPPVRGLIQTNVFTDGGSSGGPLLNYEGHMIGIIRGGWETGISFAIPSSVVIKIISQLIKYSKANCPGLNIEIFSDYLIDKECNKIGAKVMHVAPHSRASGFLNYNNDRLIEQDIIISVGDKPVTTKGDLFEILEEYRTGDTIILTVVRDQKFKLTLSIPFEDY